MDSTQQITVIAGVILLLGCGVLYRKRRGRLLVATSTVGATLGAVVFPKVFGLVMGYRAAGESVNASPTPLGQKELHELIAFYTMDPVADTIPRGMALGLLIGLVVGLMWPGRQCPQRRPPATAGRASDG
jgi:LPXTG-motif cell wall-anchored protein